MFTGQRKSETSLPIVGKSRTPGRKTQSAPASRYAAKSFHGSVVAFRRISNLQQIDIGAGIQHQWHSEFRRSLTDRTYSFYLQTLICQWMLSSRPVSIFEVHAHGTSPNNTLRGLGGVIGTASVSCFGICRNRHFHGFCDKRDLGHHGVRMDLLLRPESPGKMLFLRW